MSRLARLLDTGALDADQGPHARLRITVPAAWAASLIELALPRAMECARCDGGGCDGCARSGALRGPESETARVVRVHLPEMLGEGIVLRLAHPFGRTSRITQLLLEVRPGASAARCARRLAGPVAPPRPAPRAPSGRRPLPRSVPVMAAFVLILGLGLALTAWTQH